MCIQSVKTPALLACHDSHLFKVFLKQLAHRQRLQLVRYCNCSIMIHFKTLKREITTAFEFVSGNFWIILIFSVQLYSNKLLFSVKTIVCLYKLLIFLCVMHSILLNKTYLCNF